MNKTLERAIERVRALPPDQQDYAAAVLEEIATASATSPYRMTDEERALVREGLDDIDAGRIVSQTDMEAFWNRHRK